MALTDIDDLMRRRADADQNRRYGTLDVEDIDKSLREAIAHHFGEIKSIAQGMRISVADALRCHLTLDDYQRLKP